MENERVVALEDRIPKLKQERRKKTNRRLIILLALFFSLIIMVIYFQSPLSHIREVEVTGNSIYNKDELIELSGLTKDTNIWKIKEKNIQGKLKKLPEIKSVKVKTELPSKVIISLQEYKRIAYISKDKSYIPVTENGRILKKEKTADIPASAPILFGFSEGDVLNGMIKELKLLTEDVINSISEIHSTPKKTDLLHITLYMNDGFEVSATIRGFSEKMVHYPSIVSQLNPKKKGIIDFEVGSYFKAYEREETDKVEKETEG